MKSRGVQFFFSLFLFKILTKLMVLCFLLQEGKLQEAIESLLSLEKQTRTVSERFPPYAGLGEVVFTCKVILENV